MVALLAGPRTRSASPRPARVHPATAARHVSLAGCGVPRVALSCRRTGDAAPRGYCGPVPSRRARPGALALLTLVWASLLLGWLQLTPLYRAPDETHHVDLVLRLRDGESYPPPGELDLDPKVRASYPLAGLSSEARPELASLYPLPLRTTDVPDRDASFDELRPTPGLASWSPGSRCIRACTRGRGSRASSDPTWPRSTPARRSGTRSTSCAACSPRPPGAR